MNPTSKHTVFGALARLKNAGSNKSVGEFVRDQSDVANVVTKLISSPRPPTYDGQGNRLVHEPALYALHGVSDSISQKDSDSETTLQMFPEINNAGEILISSIKSPQDMYTEEVTFTATDGLMVQPILSSILPAVKEYFTEKYNLMELFDKILRQTLLLSGSKPIAVIPENSLDDLINGTVSFSKEALSEYLDKDGFKSVGYLGDPSEPKENAKGFYGLEQFESGLVSRKSKPSQNPRYSKEISNNNNAINKALETIFITDNPNALKQKGLNNRIAQENMQRIRMESMHERTNVSLESIEISSNKLSVESYTKGTFNDRELTQLLYSSSRPKQQVFVKAKSDGQLKRYSVGEPLIMEIPAEAFIPVIQPGSEEDPVGAFVLLENGYPVSRKNQKNHFGDMRSSFQLASQNWTSGQDLASSLLRQAKHNLGGSCQTPTYDDAIRVWTDIVEADLLSRVRNGIFGQDVVITGTQQFYRMMLARAMARQNTQVVFLPKDMINYFTYKVDENGIGKSLLEDTRIISAMRAQLLFARVQGEVKNAIGRTRIHVTVPEGDPNPVETSHMVVSEIIRQRSITTPTATLNPSEVATQVQAMGLEITFEGTTIPDLKVDFEEVNTRYEVPSDSIEEILQKRVIAGLSVPYELVDAADRVDFATVAISSHLLFAKKVRDIQRVFIPQLSNFVRQVLRADNQFVIMVKKTIIENYSMLLDRENIPPEISKYKEDKNFVASLLANELISNILVELTKPDTKSLENLTQVLADHETFIEKALDNVLTEEVISASFAGEKTPEYVAAIKTAFKASIMRRKMQELGVAPEVFEMLAEDSTGAKVFDVVSDIQQHNASISQLLVNLLQKTKPASVAADTEISAIGAPSPDAFASPTSDDSSSDSFGMDDMSTDPLGNDSDSSSDSLGIDTPSEDNNDGQDDLSSDLVNI